MAKLTEKEQELLKNTFKDQDGLLILIRKFLLQGELTKDELKYLREVVNPEVVVILSKIINPKLDLPPECSITTVNPRLSTWSIIQLRAMKLT